MPDTTDKYGRRIDYLRISVTDRCNLRCVYCMPEEGVQGKCHEEILTIEEIYAFAQRAAEYGIKRIRLTGGEPLVRLGIVDLVRKLNSVEGIEEISLTTNGILLPKLGQELFDAGLKRVNISLDTLDPEVYHAITRRGNLKDVLHAIEVADEIGFAPIKINAVAVRSLIKDPLEFARMTIDRPLHIRFIEYMPIGQEHGPDSTGGGWTAEEAISSQELREMISAAGVEAGLGELIRIPASQSPAGAGPAEYWHFKDSQGTVGFISPLSNHFCGACNRLRLTADGKLRPCLFSDKEFDVREPLRAGDSAGVDAVIARALEEKPESHEFHHGTLREMSQIGG